MSNLLSFFPLLEKILNQYHIPTHIGFYHIFMYCQHPCAIAIQELQNKVYSLLHPYPSLWREYMLEEWSFPSVVFEDLELISKKVLTVWDHWDHCLDELDDVFSECSVYHPYVSSSSSSSSSTMCGEFIFDLDLWKHHRDEEKHSKERKKISIKTFHRIDIPNCHHHV